MSGAVTARSAADVPISVLKDRFYSWIPLGCLLLAVTVVHHPVLWIDNVLWDEVSFEKMSATGDLTGKISSLSDQGVGAAYPFYVLFSHFAEPTRTLRLFSFLSIWTVAVVIYRVLRRRAGLNIAPALGASLVMATYPAFQMYANAGAAIYVIHLAIFFLAADCYLNGWAGLESRRWWLVPAAALWTTSFTLQPLLVYFYAFFAALAISRPMAAWQIIWHTIPQRAALVRIHAVLGCLPFLHYFLQKALFPLHPYFAGWYNRPNLDFSKNLRDGLVAVDSSLFVPVRHILVQDLPTWALTFVTGVSLLYLIRVAGRQQEASAMTQKPLAPSRLILAGIVLLVGGLFPFVVTGKPPAPAGPESRFAVLVAPSLAIIMAGCLSGTAGISHRGARWISGFLGCWLLAGFALTHIRVYIGSQAAAIKDHAIVAALRTQSPPPQINYFIITGPGLEYQYTRRHYDWSYLLHKAWGGYDRTAEMLDRRGPIDHHYYTPVGLSREKMANFRQWMGYGHPGPPDSWCRIDFFPSTDFDFDLDPWSVVATDLGYRVRGNAGEREAWLKHFIPHMTISAPIPHPFGIEALSQQYFKWEPAAGWRELSPQTSATLEPVMLKLHVHENIKGRFSIIPLGHHGFALRCDSLPVGGGTAEVNIELRPAAVGEPDQHNFGIAGDVHAFGGASLPRLFLVAPGKETEGSRPRPDLDRLEAWVSEPPLRAWIIWTAAGIGDCAQVKNLRFGSVERPSAPSL